ncbi:hypothetical protein JCM8547_008309 [Rhodosporidiobolus lusitaniae]
MPSVENAPTKFDASIHLCYKKPEKVVTMSELKLEGQGISDVGVTAPFPLFTREGVTALRREIFSEAVYDKYSLESPITAFQGREFPKEVCPFIHEAWSSPEVLAAVSEAAGIDLVPIMDLEFGSTNFQLPSGLDRDGFLSTSHDPKPQPLMTAEQDKEAREKAEADSGDGSSFVKYHRDAYPFVAVLMLSDVHGMHGGETAVRTGDGRTLKVRGPSVGSCVVLQGRHITHAALRAYGAGERCTLVTSFRARDPMVNDASVLPTIRIISKKNRLNYQWTDYRFKLLSERFAIMAKQLEDKKKSFGPEDDADGLGGREVVNIEEMTKFIDQQIAYLETTKREWMTKEFDEYQKDMMTQ